MALEVGCINGDIPIERIVSMLLYQRSTNVPSVDCATTEVVIFILPFDNKYKEVGNWTKKIPCELENVLCYVHHMFIVSDLPSF